MRRRRPFVVAAIVLGSALAACSVITGLNADYTTRTDGENGVDGESDALAPVGDAGPDMTTPAMDAMIDNGPFCAKHMNEPDVAYCWDFESSGGQLTEGFTFSDIESPIGAMALTQDGGLLGTVGVLASLTNVAASSGQAYLAVDILDGGADTFDKFSLHEFSFAFAVRSNSVRVVTLGSFGLAIPAKQVYTGVTAYLQDDDASTAVDVSSPPGINDGVHFATMPNAWYRAFIRMQRGLPGSQYAVTTSVKNLITDEVDASLADEVDNKVKFDGGAYAAQLQVGAFFSSFPGGSVEVALDDILYKRSP